MSDLEKRPPDENCNARKSDGSGYCKHEAGWGTNHTGHGRCRYHGGSSPSGEKSVLKDLEGAAEHAAVALELQLKELKRRIESGEEIDPSELDRLARTVLDRTGYGPKETKELEGGEDIGKNAGLSDDERDQLDQLFNS